MTREPIAIVGMGGVFPGADSLDAFWELIASGRDATREVPEQRWEVPPHDVLAAGPEPDRVYALRGGFLESHQWRREGVSVDPGLDPSVHIALAAGLDAWRGTRTAPLDTARVGCVLGHIALPTPGASRRSWHTLGPHESPVERSSRRVTSRPATELAAHLGLGGPAYTLDAACASSLFALQLACDELCSGRVDAMLAGGLQAADSLYLQMGFSQLRALSRSGRCRPFDRRADGLVVGEGGGIVALKRLEDARAHGDAILAVIRGIGLSNDTDGALLSPSADGQLRALRAAYRSADWKPDDVQLIECHGTGTPAGDRTELESLRALWRDASGDARAVIGSVKSNVGHLLTGAGAAGLIKVLLALREGVLPPTASCESPREDLNDGPFRVLREALPWPAGPTRRAGLSAFGFGGTNAHVLLERPLESTKIPAVRTKPRRTGRIAIVGMGVQIGDVAGVEAFTRGLLNETTAEPSRRIDELRLGARAFRIPPSELAELLPQQLLMMTTASEAVAACAPSDPLRAGVFIGANLDPNTTQYHVRWKLLADGHETAADQVTPPLNASRTLGSLASIIASRIAREAGIGGPSYTVSNEENSGLTALITAVRALQSRSVDYALAGAVELGCDPRLLADRTRSTPPADGAAAVVLKRLEDVRDDEIVYAVLDDVELLRHAGNPSEPDAVEQRFGDTGAARTLVRLVAEVRQLHHQMRPDGYWIHDRREGRRHIELTHDAADGSRARARLSESERPAHPRAPLRETDERLVAVAANDRSTLARRLRTLSGDLHAHARKPVEPGRLHAAFCARTGDELQRLASVTAEALQRGDTSRLRETSGGRAFCTLHPAGPDALAFVYPGSGNHFPGMGRELCARFSAVMAAQDRREEALRSQLAADAIWSKDAQPDPQALIQAQVCLGTVVTDILGWLGVRPRHAVGYSLGESAALFSLGAWTDRNEMLRRMEATPLFRRDLAGAFAAMRTAWHVDRPDWVMAVLDRSAAQVRPLTESAERVALLIVNTPQQCVVGGHRPDVEALAARLGESATYIHGTTSVHCDVVEPVRDAYRDLHVLPTSVPEGIRFYSGAWGRSYDLNQQAAADAILAQATDGVDFPAVIEDAWEHGARVFVEIGPGSSCTRMISKILGDRPHTARAVMAPGSDPMGQLLRVLAMLISEGVTVDTSRLLPERGDTAPSAGPPIVIDVRRPSRVRLPSRPVERPSARRRNPPSEPSPPVSGSGVVAAVVRASEARSRAHEVFLRMAQENTQTVAGLLASAPGARPSTPRVQVPAPFMDREACLEFARGTLARALGPELADIDRFPTRVRLPDEPLMLVDRIVETDAVAGSMKPASVVTEHDVSGDRWYLDNGRIPTGVAIEAGQADLFLSGYLGIDRETRGEAVYRLLDAAVTFHRELPVPGESVRYDIRIKEFFRQAGSWFFRFEFDGTVDGEPLLTMRDGLAGFFTPEQLAAGAGVKLTRLDRRPLSGTVPADWKTLAEIGGTERYDEHQLDALRAGDLAGCFGAAFADLDLADASRLPSRHLRLLHRIPELDPTGGRYGLGLIRAETDIHPDDWFLTCHFVDDRVMPGTLMYESALQALRVYCMRLGWVGENERVVSEPVAGVTSRLRCRGQVTENTRRVTYEIHVKELGYGPAPFAIADARMYADDKHVVEISDMCLRLSGLERGQLERQWERSPRYDRTHILEFAQGSPSRAFGPDYRPFDGNRFIARLPRPPYSFIDEIVRVTARPFEFREGGEVTARVRLDRDNGLFTDNRSEHVSYAVLNEVALQPCGWLAAYIGSALRSDNPLHFRNLGGNACMHRDVAPGTTLHTDARMTGLSQSGDTIILHYDFTVRDDRGPVYDGSTYFGFFSPEALAAQVGIRETELQTVARMSPIAMPADAPFPDVRLRMLDRIDAVLPEPDGTGLIQASKSIRPDEWFFEAHFLDDPVWPGSLGLEAFLQALKVYGTHRWGQPDQFETVRLNKPHAWTYRGQVLPSHQRVAVQARITHLDETSRTLVADGLLAADGRVIYRMEGFAMQWRSKR